jgi:hypothetical protein
VLPAPTKAIFGDPIPLVILSPLPRSGRGRPAAVRAGRDGVGRAFV